MKKRSLYLVQYEARPLPESDSFAHCSGAAVNVWVDAPSETHALTIAAQEIRDAGWQLVSLENVFPITRDAYVDDDSGLKYFEQASIDGIALAFYTWQDDTQH